MDNETSCRREGSDTMFQERKKDGCFRNRLFQWARRDLNPHVRSEH